MRPSVRDVQKQAEILRKAQEQTNDTVEKVMIAAVLETIVWATMEDENIRQSINDPMEIVQVRSASINNEYERKNFNDHQGKGSQGSPQGQG